MRARKYFLKKFCTFEKYFCTFEKIFACSENIFELFLKIFFANRRRRSGERVFEKIIFDSERFSIFLKSQEKTSRERKNKFIFKQTAWKRWFSQKNYFSLRKYFCEFLKIIFAFLKKFSALSENIFFSFLKIFF